MFGSETTATRRGDLVVTEDSVSDELLLEGFCAGNEECARKVCAALLASTVLDRVSDRW